MTLYRVGFHKGHPAGQASVLVGDLGKRTQRLLPAPLFSLLSQCQSFQSLENHAKDVWRPLSLGKKRRLIKPIVHYYSEQYDGIIIARRGFERMLVKIFERWAEWGYFVSQDQLVEWVSDPKDTGSPPPIASIGIVTRDRVQALSHGLSSYVENSVRWKRENDFLVFDDSAEEKTRNDYRQSLQTLSRRHSVPILYAGLEEKQQFAQALVKGGIPEDTVSFSLFGAPGFPNTYGANRNAFLLHSAGDMVFSADDDTVCRVTQPSTQHEGLKIETEPSRYDVWYHATRDAAMAMTPEVDQDLLAIHEKLLGKSVGQAIRDHSGPGSLDVGDMSPPFLDGEGKTGKILVTFNGLVGDSGSNSSVTPLFAAGLKRERLLRSSDTYAAAFQSREMVKAVSQIKIGPSYKCMTTFLGLDNRDIVPPFFPLFRMEDALFGRMIQKCLPDACFGHLPWQLAHLPLKERNHESENFQLFTSFSCFDAVMTGLMIFSLGPEKKNPAQNLRRLGQHLMEFGSLPLEEYRTIVLEHRRKSMAAEIGSCEDLLLQYPKSPDYWTNDVKKLIQQARGELERGVLLAPETLVAKLGQDKAEQSLQKFIWRFGKLLQWWPDMVQTAKTLRRSGVRLAQPI